MPTEELTTWQENIKKELAELRERVEKLEGKQSQEQPLTWQ